MHKRFAVLGLLAIMSTTGCQSEAESPPKRIPGTTQTASVDRPCMEAGGELVKLREAGRASSSTYCRIEQALVDAHSWFRAQARQESTRMTDFFSVPAAPGATCESLGGAVIPATDSAGLPLELCRFADESAVGHETMKAGATATVNQKISGLVRAIALHDDPCATAELPPCPKACGWNSSESCDTPCADAGDTCGSVTGAGRSCLGGTWSCTPPKPITSGCNRVCR